MNLSLNEVKALIMKNLEALEKAHKNSQFYYMTEEAIQDLEKQREFLEAIA